ncbi:hypothetical protein L1987_42424 [Smallanthus sonchifolius]|uniref:Uncharacterized protein n=1 Tax=Smallanthus sonchifolius TaxID=185202 RepID=A0ACB9GIR2_9ASTR|nr:hypothetical protein L1987_42424 [Smallanthus sonchifolius]
MLQHQIVGDEHYETTEHVKQTLQHYKELQDIIAILGLDELSEDRLTVARVRMSDNGRSLMNLVDKFKGKLVVFEDCRNYDQDENRWIEWDFLQLSENSSKREVEDDESYGMNGDKKPKLETLVLSLALPD